MRHSARGLVFVIAAAASLAPSSRAHSADPPSPPGLDGFSERVLKGLRLRVGARAAGTAPDGTIHVVYGESLLRHAWNSGSGWQTETLDGTHGRGLGAALAFDAAGDLHVAYADPLGGALFHGEKSGTTWTSRRVDESPSSADSQPAIAVSSDGVVHVAWFDDFEKTLRYAHDASGSFATTTLATDGGYGSDLDMALASDGTPHVVFMSVAPFIPGVPGNGPRALVHLERTEAGWSREELESGNDSQAAGVGAAASCAFAPDGTLHVFYLGTTDALGTPRPLRHARRSGTGWEFESVYSFGNYVYDTHAVPDATGKLHVSVLGTAQEPVAWLAMGTWGDWAFAVPPATVPTAAFTLGGGAVHFAYRDAAGSIAVQRYVVGTSDVSRTTLDSGSEPLLAPAVAADATGLPRIAIVRPDASGRRVEVLRRAGLAWDLGVAATGAIASVRPSLRVAPDGSSSVAFATEDRRIVCASDASGAWTTETVFAELGLPVNALLAHAVAPDGTRRVAWTDAYDPTLHVATETEGGWTVSDVAPSPGVLRQFDAEVTGDGTTHLVWLGFDGIMHASDAGGSWTTEVVGPADGGWGVPRALDLVASPQGDLWIGFSIPWQLWDFADAYTNRGGAWSILGMGQGDVAALGFLADGSVRGAGWQGGVVRYREAAPQWRQDLLDAGPGAARQFASAQSALTEGDAPSLVGVSAMPPPNGTRVATLGAAIDAAGVLHAAYVDSATGDLRYATDRNPGRPFVASLEIVRGPGSVDDADAAFAPAFARFGDDDSGTKFVAVSIAQDDQDEPEETLVLDLANPSGVELGSASRHTVRLVDDDPTLPPPPPPAEHFDSFLPTKARVAADGSVTAHGILHLGDLTLTPQAPLVVAWGERELTVPTLRARRGGVLAWSEGGASFSLRRERGSAARYRFDLRLPAGDPGTAGPFVVRLELEGAEPSSTVNLVRGRLDLARGIGWFDDPPLHLETLRGASGEPGSMALAAYVEGLGGVPDVAPRVWITVGALFAREIAPDAFRADGSKWIAGSRKERVVVDFGRGSVSARFDEAPVGLPPEDVSAVDVQVRVLVSARDVARALRTQITTSRGKFRN